MRGVTSFDHPPVLDAVSHFHWITLCVAREHVHHVGPRGHGMFEAAPLLNVVVDVFERHQICIMVFVPHEARHCHRQFFLALRGAVVVTLVHRDERWYLFLKVGHDWNEWRDRSAHYYADDWLVQDLRRRRDVHVLLVRHGGLVCGYLFWFVISATHVGCCV